MHHPTIILLLIFSLHHPLLQAADLDKQKDTAGFGIGALIGGIIGGPVGAIAGATGGSWLGGREANNDRYEQTLVAELAQGKQQLSALQDRIEANRSAFEQRLRAELEAAERDQRASMLSHLNEIRIDLYYTTGDARLRVEQRQQLAGLATLLRAFPELYVHLQGHADRRGEQRSNLQLSQQRLLQVEQLLIRAGVNNTRIQSHAFGELHSRASQLHAEELFYDRRVSIHLSPDSEV